MVDSVNKVKRNVALTIENYKQAKVFFYFVIIRHIVF